MTLPGYDKVLMNCRPLILFLLWMLFCAVGLCQTAFSAGSISGQGRIERIAGNPSAGYKNLYEWDLFLSPSDDSILGPSRRLGAPPGESPRGDGYYRIDDMPAGQYSVYVNQPDFYASPKVVANVEIIDGQTTTLNVDLDVDYSTYFCESNQWTEWQWDWYQTFTARGISIRGISWVMAGWNQYDGKTAEIKILEDNGAADVRNWTLVGSGSDGHLSADSDEWVRFTSGQVPITPGKQYAVDIHIDDGMAVYKRDKDAQSYQGGRAFDQNGNPMDFDLNMTVFTDHDQMVTHTSKSSGPGELYWPQSDSNWGQTFVASGRGLAAVDLFAAGSQENIELTWSVYEDGPGGRQVGPTKQTQGAYFASSTDLIGVSFNPDEIELIAGETYYIEVVNTTQTFTPYVQQSWDRYDDGTAFHNGQATDQDLSMTIVEYGPLPEPPIPGDVNLDGVVDAADAAVLAANWQMDTGATWADGDFNQDGAVDDADATVLAANWQTGTDQPSDVPEPSLIFGVLCIAMAGLVMRGKR